MRRGPRQAPAARRPRPAKPISGISEKTPKRTQRERLIEAMIDLSRRGGIRSRQHRPGELARRRLQRDLLRAVRGQGRVHARRLPHRHPARARPDAPGGARRRRHGGRLGGGRRRRLPQAPWRAPARSQLRARAVRRGSRRWEADTRGARARDRGVRGAARELSWTARPQARACSTFQWSRWWGRYAASSCGICAPTPRISCRCWPTTF